MSKVGKLATAAMGVDIQGKKEAFGIASSVIAGKKTITRDEAIKLFGEAADLLDIQFHRLDTNMRALADAEISISKEAKALMSRAKDSAGQIGNALARIDQVVTKDYDKKLQQLERFVEAMERLDALKRAGRLDAVISAFKGDSA